MLAEDISTEGPFNIYCSEQFNPFDSSGKVQLEVSVEHFI